MSGATLTPRVVSLPVPQRPFVASDLDDVAWDGRRWEVIDGMLVVSPAHAHYPFPVRVVPSELVR